MPRLSEEGRIPVEKSLIGGNLLLDYFFFVMDAQKESPEARKPKCYEAVTALRH